MAALLLKASSKFIVPGSGQCISKFCTGRINTAISYYQLPHHRSYSVKSLRRCELHEKYSSGILPCRTLYTSGAVCTDNTQDEEAALCDEERQLENDPEVKQWKSQLQADFKTSKSQQSLDKTDNLENHPEVIEWKTELETDFQTPSSQPNSDLKDYLENDPHIIPFIKQLQSDFKERSQSQEKKQNLLTQEADLVNLPEGEEELEEYEEYVEGEEDEEHVELEDEHSLPIPLSRGLTGVFDVQEVVTLLRSEGARDICVLKIPADMQYVDHMVLVSGRSARHLLAMAELLKWAYKQKRRRGDPRSVNVEGEKNCPDWKALDLGNIALHLFLPATRRRYDLETLWCLGPEYDEQFQTPSQAESQDPFESYFSEAFKERA